MMTFAVEESEKMDDYISRQAAIEALSNEIIKRRLDDVNDGMLDEFDTESILRKVPSADVREVKRGRWKMDVDWKVWEGFLLTCSVCNKKSIGGNFCPNCGAENREVTE